LSSYPCVNKWVESHQKGYNYAENNKLKQLPEKEFGQPAYANCPYLICISRLNVKNDFIRILK